MEHKAKAKENSLEKDYEVIYLTEDKKKDKNTPKKSNNSVKVNEINSMLNEGFSVDEISERLNIGKGEVLLIQELYLK